MNDRRSIDNDIDADFVQASISLCICTMNRPDDLDRCLKAVFQSSILPDEVIVSDDSLDSQPAQSVVANYPGVIYQQGPRRGLSPNRNACIRASKGSHIIFIDDDVCVPPNFFATARKIIDRCDDRAIVTGYEIKHGEKTEKVVPHNLDFWGLQRVPVRDDYRAIVINSTIFPRRLFQQASFDENLRYGSEEIDMAVHAVAMGYRIVYDNSLYVDHYPSPINREQYQQFIHASRLYATLKSYWQYERSAFKALAYLLLAPLQLAGSSFRRNGLRGLRESFNSIALAGRYLLTYLTGLERANKSQFKLIR